MKRRNPFPGVNRITDRHGKVRWRFRRKGFSTYLPGPYASPAFRAAYEAALAEGPVKATAPRGTRSWLVESYLSSPKFAKLSPASRQGQRRQFDWLREVAGDLPFHRFEVRHVEALMAKKEGPHAANTVAKRLSSLFACAQRLGLMTHNPARHAERRKTGGDRYHTWTETEIEQFLARHPKGSKARLALLLILNTGAARQDVARLGWQNVTAGRIRYPRGKTKVEADLPILGALAAELRHVPRDRLIFLATDAGAAHTAAGFGNWFAARCAEAGLAHSSAHGLRKAGATRLAEAGASEHEIMAFLAHSSPREGATYTRKAQRSRLADAAFARLPGPKSEQNLSNLAERLDKATPQTTERK